MNEAILQLVNRAIRADRAALRTLLDRYQGLSYALAFRQCRNFPQALNLAMDAWPIVARRLPKLTEPERFVDLLAEAVEAAFQDAGGVAAETEEVEAKQHSILRTGKVQMRRHLRHALVDCPLDEAAVFFMRYVQGLSVEEIAVLYGVEPTSVVTSLRAVCVDLAYRAGFAADDRSPPDPASLSEDRKEAQGFAVLLVEGGGVPYAERTRIEKYIQADPAARREDDAVHQVLGLATGTFAAHRLPDQFCKDVLLKIPYTEPVRKVEETSPVMRRSTTTIFSQDVPRGPSVALGLVGLLVGLLVTLLVVLFVEDSLINPLLSPHYGAQSLALTLFLMVMGVVGLMFGKPPLSNAPPRLSPSYYMAFGLIGGVFLAMLGALAMAYMPTVPGAAIWAGDGTKVFLIDVLLPMWAVSVLALNAWRGVLVFHDLERRIELRLRRMEDGHVSQVRMEALTAEQLASQVDTSAVTPNDLPGTAQPYSSG